MKILRDFAQYSKNKINIQKNNVFYVGVDNINQNKSGVSEPTYLPSSGNYTKFVKGDILIGNIRPYLKKIWLSNTTGIASPDVLVISPKDYNLSGFIFANLLNDSFFDYVMVGAKGSKMPRGDKAHIMNYPIVDIANKIEIGEIAINIDRKIENNKKINDILERQAKLIYDYWFTQFDFPDENGKPYRSSGGKMVWNKQLKRKIPQDWEVAPLSHFLSIKSGYPFSTTSYAENGEYKLITIKNVQLNGINLNVDNYINDLPENIPNYCFLNKGDILMSLTGNVGRVGVMYTNQCLLNQRVANILPLDENLRPFVYYMLKSDTIYKFYTTIASGSSQKNLSPVEAEEIKIAYSFDYMEKFSQLLKSNFEIIVSNLQENDKLSKLRDWLLPMLMNGQATIKQ